MISRKFLFIAAFATLAACGITPKADIATKDKPQKPLKPCEGDYNPVSLFVPGQLPLAEVENLPAGLYANHGVELFAIDDQTPSGVQQAHFQEIFLGESGAIRPVCHSVIDPRESAMYIFPALRLLTIDANGAKSREDAIYQILNSRGKFQAEVRPDPAKAATGLAALMAKFRTAYLYRTGLDSYELHGEIREPLGKGIVTKFLVQKIQYIPPESN